MAVSWCTGQRVEVVRGFPFGLCQDASSTSLSCPAAHVCFKLGTVIEATEDHAVVKLTVVRV